MFKKIVFSFIFVLAFAIPTLGTEITVTNIVFTNWRYGGSTAKLRIFLNDKIITSTGVTKLPGGIQSGGTWYREVACTVTSNTVTCANAVLDSTTDSSNVNATYTAVFYDYKNIRRDYLFQRYKVPHTSGTTITYTQLFNYQSAVVTTLPASYYTSSQVDLLLGSYATDIEVAAALVSGLATKADTTDSRFEQNLSNYGGNLATAISTINASGTPPTTLNISDPLTVSASGSVPNNICLQVVDNGLITVSASQTLTIGCFIDPGQRKVFTTSASGAKVLFTKAAVDKIKIVWWTGPTSGQTVTDPISEALESANVHQMPIHFTQGLWLTSGDHNIDEGVTIEGEGNHLFSNLGTAVKLVSPTSDNVFNIGEINYSVRFKNIIIDGTGTTNKYGVLFRGTFPDSSGDVAFDKVTIQDFNKGIYYNDVEVGGNVNWQMAQVKIDHCVFWNNTTAVHAESLNSAFYIVSSNFYIPNNSVAIYTNGIGITNIIGNEFAGMVGGGTPTARKVLVIDGAHVNINVEGNQDEGNTTFIENNASDITGIVAVKSNLVQSNVYINASMVYHSEANNYLPDGIRVLDPATPFIKSEYDNIRIDTATAENPGVIPANPLRLIVNASDLASNDPIAFYEFNPILRNYRADKNAAGLNIRHFGKFYLQDFMSGMEATPVLEILDGVQGTSETQKLLRIGRGDGTTQLAQFYYDFYRRNSGTSAGRLSITGNQGSFTGVDIDTNLRTSGITVGRNQVESNTVVAASGITTSGNARVIVTAAGMTGSPKTVTVALTTTAHTTADKIAEALELALQNDADVSGFFNVNRQGTVLYLSNIVHTPNDGTMNFTIEDVTSVGITDSVTSTTVFAGMNGSLISSIIKTTVNVNFASILAQETAEATITVTGATIGGVVQASPHTSIENHLVWSGYVSATDTVKLRISNITAGAIDPAAKDWSIIVTQ